METTDLTILSAGPIVLAHAVDNRGRYHSEILSGDGIFAAAGARLWAGGVHLLGRIGEDVPGALLKELEDRGIHTGALRTVEKTRNTRVYYEAAPDGIRFDPNAASFFRSIQRPIPKVLLDTPVQQPTYAEPRSFPTLAVRPDDIPDNLLTPDGALVTGDFLSQITIPSHLHQFQKTAIVLAPPTRIMEIDYRENLALLLTGISTVVIKSSDLPESLSQDSEQLLRSAEELCSFGCSRVVFTRGASGQLAWDHETRTAYHVPAYPSSVVDPIGSRAGFCGGFLAGFLQTGDLLEAVLHGSVSASLIVEGTKAFHALDALPGLPEARLDFLRGRSRKVNH